MIANSAIPNSILEQAQAWYIRLGAEDATPTDWADFTDWLEKSETNLQAYDQVELAVDDILQEPVVSEPVTNVVQFQPKLSRLRPSFSRRYAGIAALFIIAISAFNLSGIEIIPPQTQQYATVVGDQQSITLADGTFVTLNTNTKLSTTMSKRTRHVTLESGEAYFQIAQDSKRPFVIDAMGMTITDIGTAFSVSTINNTLSVSVSDGIVDIKSPYETVRVTKGHNAITTRAAKVIKVSEVDLEAELSWRGGVLIYDAAPLADIVPDLNRYFSIPITISDEAVANMMFSGALNISSQEDLLHALEDLLPVAAVEGETSIDLTYRQ